MQELADREATRLKGAKRKEMIGKGKYQARKAGRFISKHKGKLIAGGIGAGIGALAMKKEAANQEIYDIAYDRAEEFLKEGGLYSYDGSTIDNLAIEVLEDHGYYVD